jgi:succinylglutamate desuccinylase
MAKLGNAWICVQLMVAPMFIPPIPVVECTKPMSVVVVGGCHGNEYTGVWVVKSLDRQIRKDPTKYSSAFINVSTIVGNPAAVMANRRFIDEDLNRQFSHSKLKEEESASSSTVAASAAKSLEAKRAQELDQILGPKFSDNPNADVIIDLHTTTANMKTCIIIGEGDPLMAQAAAYILSKCQDASILLHTHKGQRDRPSLSSIAPHFLSIEVGPVPQGVLRHDSVDRTQKALEAGLEFLARHQTQPDEVRDELRRAFPSGRIPCVRSAPSTRPGEMSSKIQWPSDPENNNFPAWMVHPNVQDQDFMPIHEGDPLFVDLDGNDIFYDGSHGSPVLLMFINEGGYYYKSSGTGISVARRDEFSLETGKLFPEDSNNGDGDGDGEL